MADKTYRMTVTLSDGSTVTAGTFVAPQGPQGVRGATGPRGPEGPQGPQGPAGALPEPQSGDQDTFLQGTYLIMPVTTGLYSIMTMGSGAVSINNITYENGEISLYILQGDTTRDPHLMGKPYTLKITSTGITKTEDAEIPYFQYIKLTD